MYAERIFDMFYISLIVSSNDIFQGALDALCM